MLVKAISIITANAKYLMVSIAQSQIEIKGNTIQANFKNHEEESTHKQGKRHTSHHHRMEREKKKFNQKKKKKK